MEDPLNVWIFQKKLDHLCHSLLRLLLEAHQRRIWGVCDVGVDILDFGSQNLLEIVSNMGHLQSKDTMSVFVCVNKNNDERTFEKQSGGRIFAPPSFKIYQLVIEETLRRMFLE